MRTSNLASWIAIGRGFISKWNFKVADSICIGSKILRITSKYGFLLQLGCFSCASHEMRTTDGKSISIKELNRYQLSADGSQIQVWTSREAANLVVRKSPDKISVTGDSYLSRGDGPLFDVRRLFTTPSLQSTTIGLLRSGNITFDFDYFLMEAKHENNEYIPKEVRLTYNCDHASLPEIELLAEKIRRNWPNVKVDDQIVTLYQRKLIRYIAENGIPKDPEGLWLAAESDSSSIRWHCDLLKLFISNGIRVKPKE